jgi:hemerythrin-like domain-containing protein
MNKLTTFIHHEHTTLRPHVELIRVAADAVGEVPLPILRDLTNAVLGFLVRELIPHARHETELLYKAVETATHSPGSTSTMNREHLEVSKMTDQLGDLHALTVAEADISEKTLRDLRRVLYGLYTLVNLHFAKEEEIYSDILEHQLSIAEQDLLLGALSRH